MLTTTKAPSKLELAEKRFHDAHEQAEFEPCADNDQWLFWSKINYEQELQKEAKREQAMLKDLNSADLNQGRPPVQSALSEKLVSVVMLLLSASALGWLLIWLVTHPVVAR